MYCSRCGTQVQDNTKFCPSCGLDLSTATPLAAGAGDPSQATEESLVRDALKEEYEILQELGRGGMAIVFKARDRQLEREVAIKVLPFSLAFDAEFVERFQREARTAARLEHPNIIPIYRVGRSGRVIYFVMKFLRGTSLSEAIEKRGALPADEIRALLVQTAGALGYAHTHGIVHRDIKPDNIMFDELGHAIVTDFGIAKAASGTRLTGTGMSIGTPHYMSPEQARAQPLDGRSDLYSLGVVAYQCLTGHVPFDGEDAFSIGYKHIMEELPEPSLSTPAQRDVFAVIRRMMAKTPEERFQDAAELVAVLEGRPTAQVRATGSAAADAPTVALSAVGATPATRASGIARPSTPTTPMPRADVRRPAPKRKKRSGVLVGALLVLIAGGGGGAYYLTQMRGAPTADRGSVPPDTAAAESSSVRLAGPVTAVDSATRGPDSMAAAPASATVASPADTMGVLVVTNMPRGGRVFIDTNPGTPDTVLRLGIGSHKVRVRSVHKDVTGSAQIARGDTVVFSANGATMVVSSATPAATPSEPAVKPAPPKPKPPEPTCEDPRADTYNLAHACFDAPPRLDGVPFIKVDASMPDGTQVPLWIHVSKSGAPLEVRPAGALSAVVLKAIEFARGQPYSPATKGGASVDAWFQLTFVTQH